MSDNDAPVTITMDRSMLRTITANVRAATIEECAMLAEMHGYYVIASAIRALLHTGGEK